MLPEKQKTEAIEKNEEPQPDQVFPSKKFQRKQMHQIASFRHKSSVCPWRVCSVVLFINSSFRSLEF